MWMSASSERPIVAPSRMSNVVPGSNPIAATTSSRGSTPPANWVGWGLRRELGASGGSAAARPVALVAREVAHRAAGHPEEEEVEDGEEAELERDRERLVHGRLLELEGQVGYADRYAVTGAQRASAPPAAR